MPYLLGIDIYNGNSDNYDMAAVKRDGIGFLIHKCSQGWLNGPGGWMDWKFVGAINRARAAGIELTGGYHWLLKGNGAAQAQLFYASIARCGGPHGMIAAVDVERNDWDQSLNPDAPTLTAFLDEWDRLTGRQPIFVYGASWYHDGYAQLGTQFCNRPLWWAGYSQRSYPAPIGQLISDVTPSYFAAFGGWTSYAIRQWTSDGLVAGQQSDCNVFFGTAEQLRELTVPAGVTPPKRASTVYKPVGSGVNVKSIQGAVFAVEDGVWGPDTDRRCEAVRRGGPTLALQQYLRVTADGIWGPVTEAARTRAVRGVQTGLGVSADGRWGPVTDRAYLTASPLR